MDALVLLNRGSDLLCPVLVMPYLVLVPSKDKQNIPQSALNGSPSPTASNIYYQSFVTCDADFTLR